MAMNSKLQKPLLWAVVLSESSHVFCCVFPTIFSLVGLLAGLGMVVTLPASMISLHDFLHDWELPMILGSGAILGLGWLATWYSDKINCHSTGCCHGACAPRKSKAHLILKIATILFVFNVCIYAFVHRSGWFEQNSPLMTHQEEPENGHLHP